MAGPRQRAHSEGDPRELRQRRGWDSWAIDRVVGWRRGRPVRSSLARSTSGHRPSWGTHIALARRQVWTLRLAHGDLLVLDATTPGFAVFASLAGPRPCATPRARGLAKASAKGWPVVTFASR